MINEIIYAISRALHEEFGESHEIYMEEISQDLKEPCFLINTLEPSVRHYPGGRYLRRNYFCIQYFPETEEKYAECNRTAERMTDVLEVIETEAGSIRGTDMRYRTEDGVLNFFINYNFFTICSRKQEDEMQGIRTDTGVKE